MKGINPKYSGRFNNYFDGLRIFQAFRKSYELAAKEMQLLLFSIVLNIISHISTLVLIAILLFGPGIMTILNP